MQVIGRPVRGGVLRAYIDGRACLSGYAKS